MPASCFYKAEPERLIVAANLAADLTAWRQRRVNIGIRQSLLDCRRRIGERPHRDALSGGSDYVCRDDRASDCSASSRANRRPRRPRIRRRSAKPDHNATSNIRLRDMNVSLCHRALQTRHRERVV